MNFYTCTLFVILICSYNTTSDSNPELLFLEAGLEEPNPLSVGLIFYITVNNTSQENDYAVEITPDQCCLIGDDVDCESLNILGGCTDFIARGKSKTLRIVAPILDSFERKGHCTIYVDSKSNNGPNKRDTIKINLDSTIENNNFDYPKNLEHCKNKDEDPFNECKPVNCDTYYNGRKAYFSRKYKRCVEVPPCVSDELNYPTVIYNPITNECYDNSLDKRDLSVLQDLNRSKGKGRKVKDLLIISKYQPNATELINSDNLDYDVIRVTTLKPKMKNSDCVIDHDYITSFWKRYFVNNKWTLILLSFIVTVQCFLICALFYCLSKICNCFEEKKVVRKFFNYRQDASLTTPLIGTSNMHTETDYQYLSDTSNNADKIKCYKACQKENQNLKTSMSDDILSKCLNRRDWKKFKSEAITDVYKEDFDVPKEPRVEDIREKHSEAKVVFEDEIKNIERNKSKAVNIISNVEIIHDIENSNIETNASSEKEINCHDYCFDGTGFKPTGDIDCFQTEENKTPSVSTEKGAQIYFSNDSIDDFLSERGMTYLAGENISKYTFSTDFNDMKPLSAVSSKTSKNFVKNVLSLLYKKTKGSTSDPGQKEVGVKLLHMSKASAYTSSNDSNYERMLKKRDSRTSF